MRIAYFVHGRGRGHASRALSIVERLRANRHEVAIFAGGDALDLLGADPELTRVEPVLPGALARTPSRLVHDLHALRDRRAELVVSDGDMPSILAARALHLPRLAVGHDLVFSRCALPPGLSARALLRQRVNGAATELVRHAVAVHFLPIVPRRPDVIVARPDPPIAPPRTRRSEGPVLCYFRDENGERVERLLSDAGADVVSFGRPGLAPRGVTRRPLDRRAMLETLSEARAVVCSAGSNLLAECVLARVPVLALHRARDAEQALNAAMLARAGAGLAATFEAIDTRAVRGFLGRVEARAFAVIPLERLPPARDAMLEAIARASAQPR